MAQAATKFVRESDRGADSAAPTRRGRAGFAGAAASVGTASAVTTFAYEQTWKGTL